MDGYIAMNWYVRGVDVRCIAEDVEHVRKAVGYEAMMENSKELFGFTRKEMGIVIDKLSSYSAKGPIGRMPMGWW